MKVAGLDPSLNNFGIAIGQIKRGKVYVYSIEVIQPKANPKLSKGVDDIRRASIIVDRLRELKVDYFAAEIPGGSQSSRSARLSGVCLGILAGLPNIVGVTPDQVKKVVRKNASKNEIISWAKSRYPDVQWSGQNKDEHMADAIAVIYSAFNCSV
jgi:Holliday junction resolvasome RuvABC endonuclease subunit